MEPGWLKRQVTSGLQAISRRACLHPIHTIVVIALLASTTYVGLLEGSLFDTFRSPRDVAGQVDVDTLLLGSRSLRLGENTAWKWQAEGAGMPEDHEVDFSSSLRRSCQLVLTLLEPARPAPRLDDLRFS